MPSLTWHAGRKASAVRTAAASCLWSFFESYDCSTALESTNTLSRLLTLMNGLLEDDAEQTRLFICKTYVKIFQRFQNKIPPQSLLKISSSKDGLNSLKVLTKKMIVSCFSFDQKIGGRQ